MHGAPAFPTEIIWKCKKKWNFVSLVGILGAPFFRFGKIRAKIENRIKSMPKVGQLRTKKSFINTH